MLWSPLRETQHWLRDLFSFEDSIMWVAVLKPGLTLEYVRRIWLEACRISMFYKCCMYNAVIEKWNECRALYFYKTMVVHVLCISGIIKIFELVRTTYSNVKEIYQYSIVSYFHAFGSLWDSWIIFRYTSYFYIMFVDNIYRCVTSITFWIVITDTFNTYNITKRFLKFLKNFIQNREHILINIIFDYSPIYIYNIK